MISHPDLVRAIAASRLREDPATGTTQERQRNASWSNSEREIQEVNCERHFATL